MNNILYTSQHYDRVAKFMKLAGQATPAFTGTMDEHTRISRARLMLEETLETIILGLGVKLTNPDGSVIDLKTTRFEINGELNVQEVVDGCADVHVVTTGTLVALGVPDEQLLELVDENNLKKFGLGGYRDETGKWIKPLGHKAPDIALFLTDLQKAQAELDGIDLDTDDDDDFFEEDERMELFEHEDDEELIEEEEGSFEHDPEAILMEEQELDFNRL